MGMMHNGRQSLFGGTLKVGSNDAKRATAWEDYGYPDTLDFTNFYSMFQRNGIARAGVMRAVEKTWETDPWLVEGQEGDDPHSDWTPWEKAVQKVFRETHLFNRLNAADWRGRVGRYAALYLVFADGQHPDQPVSNGRALLKAQPIFESQLTVTSWITDPASPDYGMPAMYQFNQAALGNENPGAHESLQIHPDRIHIIAEGADDDSIYGMSALEPGFNDLLTIEKIIGAGGEGFWKAARGAWALEGETDAQKLADMFGVKQDEVADRMNEVASDFASGMDKLLLLGGMKASSLSFSVPTPKEFFDVAMQSFAASVSCPMPILIGQQISQRSSDENSQEWAQTIMSRRKRFIGPNLEQLVRKLMRFGVLPSIENFYCAWGDLTEPSVSDKLANAKTMSEINKNTMGTGIEVPFQANEIRDAGGFDADPDLDNDGIGEDDNGEQGQTAGSTSQQPQPGADDTADR
ncbi:anti-CBASS protein Acb1 family protein [Phytohalomonas tamaricis]|uniref:anti-CBASS protein Acb1 family protein n=1 Tax=Phytohalomonas tamaricis TaxID=2081032 RepID=UPI000D0B07EB|nr:anti-CBASS Acb1 family protein [Phytohalomonas tamaricis]